MPRARDGNSRSVAQLGSAHAWGACGRGFKSRHSDQFNLPAMNTLLPALFIGHGSPMNAIDDNWFTQALKQLGRQLPTPELILCMSAHWMSNGVYVTESASPRMIYDMYGFPDELYRIQYAAPGKPGLLSQLQQLTPALNIRGDRGEWGLDHGCWAIMKLLFPRANIPVVQISIDMAQPAEFQLEVGKQLGALRREGVMIIGSGNIVHNLRQIDMNPDAAAFSWAKEFDEWVVGKIEARNFSSLARDYLAHPEGRRAVPTPDHYYPLLFILGTVGEHERISFPIAGIQHGSLSMRAVMIN